MGFLLLFDLTSEQSFLAVRNWLDQLQVPHIDPTGLPVLMYGATDARLLRLAGRGALREQMRPGGPEAGERGESTGDCA